MSVLVNQENKLIENIGEIQDILIFTEESQEKLCKLSESITSKLISNILPKGIHVQQLPFLNTKP